MFKNKWMKFLAYFLIGALIGATYALATEAQVIYYLNG